MYIQHNIGEFQPQIFKKINMFYGTILDPLLFIIFATTNFIITRNYADYKIENIMILAMWQGLSMSYSGLVILGILFGILYYACQNDSQFQFFHQILGRVICFSAFPFFCLYGACVYLNDGNYIDIIYWRALAHIFVLARIGNNFFAWFYQNIQRGTLVMHQYFLNSVHFRQDELDLMIPTIDQYNLNMLVNKDPAFIIVNLLLHIYEVIFMVLVISLKQLDFGFIIQTELIILCSLFFFVLLTGIICFVRSLRSGEEVQRSTSMTFLFLLWLLLIIVIILVFADCCMKGDFKNYPIIEPLIIAQISLNGQQILLKYFFKKIFKAPENDTEEQHFQKLVMKYTNLNSVSSRKKIQCEQKFLFLVNPLCLMISFILLYATSAQIQIQDTWLYRFWETALIASFILWVSLTCQGICLQKSLVIFMFSEEINDPHQTISIVWFYIFASFVERIGLKFLLILYSVLAAYLVFYISEKSFQSQSIVFPAINLFILLVNRLCYRFSMKKQHRD